MYLHEVTPKSPQILRYVRSNDGGQVALATGHVDGKDVPLIGHRSATNVGEPNAPIRWYLVSSYSGRS